MHLADLVARRPVPAAGLLVMVTGACPLSCAHCSSSSVPDAPAPRPQDLMRFVGSCTEHDRPDVILFTGGEPLLRPDLVSELAATARRAGTRTAVLSGAYFARAGTVPGRIRRAVQAVDHFSASVDVHHELFVPRRAVFRMLRSVMDGGTPVSLHAVGSGPDDPYLADLVADVRRTFGDAVPMLVNTLRAVGRASAWATARRTSNGGSTAVLPCAMAAWPVVAQDGTVLACCNQTVVDQRPVPEHLRLGHIRTETWATVSERVRSSPVLRAVRAVGPRYLLAQDGDGRGYCTGCRQLDRYPLALQRAHAIGGGALGQFLDRQAAQVQTDAGPVTFVRRHGCAEHADLVATGTREGRP